MTVLTPGFADRHASQRCFRAILDAMSRPGRIVELDVALEPPVPLSIASAALLLTLTDHLTSVAVPDAAAPWLIFHTGARIALPADADFTVSRQVLDLADMPNGTAEAPEDGATLIIDLPALTGNCEVRLSGPGVEHPRATMLPIDANFVALWRRQRERAPCGVDVVLCAHHRLLALPRSLAIEMI